MKSRRSFNVAGAGSVGLCLFGLVTACTRPGVRSEGMGEVTWADSDGSFAGPCFYRVSTRWAAQLNHMIRLEEEGGEGAIVVQSARRLPTGRSTFREQGESGGILGLAMDGGTVRGGLTGTIDASEVDGAFLVEIEGARAGRDTVGLQASCRLRPVSD